MAKDYDPNANNPDNYIQNDPFTITDSLVFFPAEGPFYEKDLSIVAIRPGEATPSQLVYGKDYFLSPLFLTASRNVAREVFSFFGLVSSGYTNIEASYRVIGGDLVDAQLAAEILALGQFDRLDRSIWLSLRGEEIGVDPSHSDPSLKGKSFLEQVGYHSDRIAAATEKIAENNTSSGGGSFFGPIVEPANAVPRAVGDYSANGTLRKSSGAILSHYDFKRVNYDSSYKANNLVIKNSTGDIVDGDFSGSGLNTEYANKGLSSLGEGVWFEWLADLDSDISINDVKAFVCTVDPISVSSQVNNKREFTLLETFDRNATRLGFAINAVVNAQATVLSVQVSFYKENGTVESSSVIDLPIPTFTSAANISQLTESAIGFNFKENGLEVCYRHDDVVNGKIGSLIPLPVDTDWDDLGVISHIGTGRSITSEESSGTILPIESFGIKQHILTGFEVGDEFLKMLMTSSGVEKSPVNLFGHVSNPLLDSLIFYPHPAFGSSTSNNLCQTLGVLNQPGKVLRLASGSSPFPTLSGGDYPANAKPSDIDHYSWSGAEGSSSLLTPTVSSERPELLLGANDFTWVTRFRFRNQANLTKYNVFGNWNFEQFSAGDSSGPDGFSLMMVNGEPKLFYTSPTDNTVVVADPSFSISSHNAGGPSPWTYAEVFLSVRRVGDSFTFDWNTTSGDSGQFTFIDPNQDVVDFGVPFASITDFGFGTPTAINSSDGVSIKEIGFFGRSLTDAEVSHLIDNRITDPVDVNVPAKSDFLFDFSVIGENESGLIIPNEISDRESLVLDSYTGILNSNHESLSFQQEKGSISLPAGLGTKDWWFASTFEVVTGGDKPFIILGTSESADGLLDKDTGAFRLYVKGGDRIALDVVRGSSILSGETPINTLVGRYVQVLAYRVEAGITVETKIYESKFASAPIANESFTITGDEIFVNWGEMEFAAPTWDNPTHGSGLPSVNTGNEFHVVKMDRMLLSRDSSFDNTIRNLIFPTELVSYNNIVAKVVGTYVPPLELDDIYARKAEKEVIGDLWEFSKGFKVGGTQYKVDGFTMFGMPVTNADVTTVGGVGSKISGTIFAGFDIVDVTGWTIVDFDQLPINGAYMSTTPIILKGGPLVPPPAWNIRKNPDGGMTYTYRNVQMFQSGQRFIGNTENVITDSTGKVVTATKQTSTPTNSKIYGSITDERRSELDTNTGIITLTAIVEMGRAREYVYPSNNEFDSSKTGWVVKAIEDGSVMKVLSYEGSLLTGTPIGENSKLGIFYGYSHNLNTDAITVEIIEHAGDSQTPAGNNTTKTSRKTTLAYISDGSGGYELSSVEKDDTFSVQGQTAGIVTKISGPASDPNSKGTNEIYGSVVLKPGNKQGTPDNMPPNLEPGELWLDVSLGTSRPLARIALFGTDANGNTLGGSIEDGSGSDGGGGGGLQPYVEAVHPLSVIAKNPPMMFPIKYHRFVDENTVFESPDPRLAIIGHHLSRDGELNLELNYIGPDNATPVLPFNIVAKNGNLVSVEELVVHILKSTALTAVTDFTWEEATVGTMDTTVPGELATLGPASSAHRTAWMAGMPMFSNTTQISFRVSKEDAGVANTAYWEAGLSDNPTGNADGNHLYSLYATSATTMSFRYGNSTAVSAIAYTHGDLITLELVQGHYARVLINGVEVARTTSGNRQREVTPVFNMRYNTRYYDITVLNTSDMHLELRPGDNAEWNSASTVNIEYGVGRVTALTNNTGYKSNYFKSAPDWSGDFATEFDIALSQEYTPPVDSEWFAVGFHEGGATLYPQSVHVAFEFRDGLMKCRIDSTTLYSEATDWGATYRLERSKGNWIKFYKNDILLVTYNGPDYLTTPMRWQVAGWHDAEVSNIRVYDPSTLPLAALAIIPGGNVPWQEAGTNPSRITRDKGSLNTSDGTITNDAIVHVGYNYPLRYNSKLTFRYKGPAGGTTLGGALGLSEQPLLSLGQPDYAFVFGGTDSAPTAKAMVGGTEVVAPFAIAVDDYFDISTDEVGNVLFRHNFVLLDTHAPSELGSDLFLDTSFTDTVSVGNIRLDIHKDRLLYIPGSPEVPYNIVAGAPADFVLAEGDIECVDPAAAFDKSVIVDNLAGLRLGGSLSFIYDGEGGATGNDVGGFLGLSADPNLDNSVPEFSWRVSDNGGTISASPMVGSTAAGGIYIPLTIGDELEIKRETDGTVSYLINGTEHHSTAMDPYITYHFDTTFIGRLKVTDVTIDNPELVQP